VTSALLEDRHGFLWVGTLDRGLLRYAPNGAVQSISKEDGLPGNSVRALFEDRESNLWIGLDGGGLVRFRERPLQMFDTRSGLSDNIILSVCEDRAGALWVGTDGKGINRYEGGKWTQFGRGDSGLENPYVTSVLVDPQGQLWVGTSGSGLLRYQNGQFIPSTNATLTTVLPVITADGRGNLSGHALINQLPVVVSALYADHQGNLWVSKRIETRAEASGWIECWHRGAVTRYDRRNGLTFHDFRAIVQDIQGDLWFGSNGAGLFRLHDGKFAQWTHKNGLAHDQVWSLYADADGALWVGTFGGGLCRLKQGRFTTYTSQTGLADDTICSIVEDDAGRLWMSSHEGIFWVAKREFNDYADGKIHSLNSVVYGTKDGLNTAECNGGFQPSSCKSRDGHLWFPTVDGLAALDSNRLHTNAVPPPVVIEQVLLDDQLQPSATSLTVPPGKKQLEIRYTALSLTAPEKVRFRYRIEGLDNGWIEADKRRSANYSHLAPGAYQFRVIACNNDGLWNETGSSLGITILTPFWRTWWFLGLGFIVTAGGLGGVLGGVLRYNARKNLKRVLTRLEQP
jgi:ligand-binding sensor domain-containing protein